MGIGSGLEIYSVFQLVQYLNWIQYSVMDSR